MKNWCTRLTLRFCGREVGDVAAVEEDAARGGLLEAGHQLDQRGLAGAGLAEEDVEAVARERQAGLVEMGLGADPLADAPEFEAHGRPFRWAAGPAAGGPGGRRGGQLASAQTLTISS